MLLSPEAKKKLTSFIVMQSMSKNKESEEENTEEEDISSETGSKFASEKIMEAIKSNDVDAFDKGLGEWFSMRPSEESEDYSNSEEED